MAAPLTAPWPELARSIAGEVHLPGWDTYEQRRRGFIARFDAIAPAAIASIATAEDAATVLDFLRQHGLPFAIRCGGHSAAGLSSTTGVLIDLSALGAFDVREETISVGAGHRTGEMAAALASRNLLVPVGTCPSVGIAGLALGGGFGHFGRAYGFTCDALVGLEAVLADGQQLHCSAESEPDLFWALRGAGPAAFALVTRLDFRPVRVARATFISAHWPLEAASRVIAAWQQWMATAPEELTSELSLTIDPDGRPRAAVEGIHCGGKDEAIASLAELARTTGASPLEQHCTDRTLSETLTICAAGASSGGGGRQGYRYMKSQLLDEPFGEPIAEALVRNLTSATARGEYRGIELAAWGGTYNRPTADACAFVHRHSLFSIQHSAMVDAGAPATAKAEARAWVRRSRELLVEAAGAGVYQNFPDLDLADPEAAYFGANLTRLRAVKRHYDPDNLFRSGQPIQICKAIA